jgi:hypothetical protein
MTSINGLLCAFSKEWRNSEAKCKAGLSHRFLGNCTMRNPRLRKVKTEENPGPTREFFYSMGSTGKGCSAANITLLSFFVETFIYRSPT